MLVAILVLLASGTLLANASIFLLLLLRTIEERRDLADARLTRTIRMRQQSSGPVR